MKKITLSRQVHFSCGHRYFNTKFNEQANKKMFGQCYSTHGHGHNYILEAEFTGPLSPETGMIINLHEVDKVLKNVSNIFDHKFVNEDVAEFKNKVPTTENMALFCFDKVADGFSATEIKLDRLRLYETQDLWVDIMAGD